MQKVKSYNGRVGPWLWATRKSHFPQARGTPRNRTSAALQERVETHTVSFNRSSSHSSHNSRHLFWKSIRGDYFEGFAGSRNRRRRLPFLPPHARVPRRARGICVCSLLHEAKVALS